MRSLSSVERNEGKEKKKKDRPNETRFSPIGVSYKHSLRCMFAIIFLILGVQ